MSSGSRNKTPPTTINLEQALESNLTLTNQLGQGDSNRDCGRGRGATITSTVTKVKRQIAIVVEDVVKTDTDVVMEVEESSAITVKILDIMYRTA
jgi:hypothetical protein